MLRSKESFFIALLLFVTLLNLYDFYNDYQEDEHNPLHLAVEVLIILFSLSGLAFLIQEIRQRRRETEQLHKQLNITRADLSSARDDLSSTRADLQLMSSKMQQASSQYGQVIQEQLTLWEFTQSEKDVALLLLKGLSFDEIATVRDTKEKTVRQQATAIYRKSGLTGRHEFAAWFFEDFLS